jgi:hypothetical protein
LCTFPTGVFPLDQYSNVIDAPLADILCRQGCFRCRRGEFLKGGGGSHSILQKVLDQGHPPDVLNKVTSNRQKIQLLFGFSISENGNERLSRNFGKKNYHYSLRSNTEERSSQIQFLFCLTQ